MESKGSVKSKKILVGCKNDKLENKTDTSKQNKIRKDYYKNMLKD